jgi:hypothetical protein
VTAHADTDTQPASWGEFMNGPGTYIDGSRLASCFRNEFGTALCQRLTTSKRLQSRLSAIIHTHYGLGPWVPPEALSEADRAIALCSSAQLNILAQRSGAIFWASTIANVILSRQVEALHQQLGEALCSFALAHRDLSGPEQSLEPPHNVGQRVTEDGWRCVGAWCQVLPAGVGVRVRLKVAVNDAIDRRPERPFQEIGPSIVRRAAS